jgi:putative transposase
LVDTQGFLLKAQVHPASISDSEGGRHLLQGLDKVFPRVELLWTDSGYKSGFAEWVNEQLHWRVECLKQAIEPKGDYAQLMREFLGQELYEQRYAKGFRLLPRRWVVERSFAWYDRQRRLAKDYELLPETGEAWLYLASGRLLWQRLCRIIS